MHSRYDFSNNLRTAPHEGFEERLGQEESPASFLPSTISHILWLVSMRELVQLAHTVKGFLEKG
jgi:hypothetical protein